MKKLSNLLQVIFNETKIPLTESNIRNIAEATAADFETKEQLLEVATKIASGLVSNPRFSINEHNDFIAEKSISISKLLIQKTIN